LDQNKSELIELEKLLQAPDFWSDQDRAKEFSQKYQNLKSELEIWEKLSRDNEDLAELAELFSSGQETFQQMEISEKLTELEKQFAKLEFNVLFAGQYNVSNAILSIHAGTGGVDAMDWASMILRMYLRFCERHNFVTKIIDETAGAEAGIKSVTLEITGRYAYGWLKSEAGVHRLVRISPFDAEKMRHTSFALVEVLPEINEDDVNAEIKEEDLKIDVFRSGGSGGQSVNTTDSAVRITHLPTGLVVKCQNERSQLQNRNMALKILKARLVQVRQETAEKNLEDIKGEYRRAEWGNQARSYVLAPYRLVKDHRTDYETSDTDRVLDGEIDDFIEKFLRLKATK
jgi:peptide chain release factor 2